MLNRSALDQSTVGKASWFEITVNSHPTGTVPMQRPLTYVSNEAWFQIVFPAPVPCCCPWAAASILRTPVPLLYHHANTMLSRAAPQLAALARRPVAARGMTTVAEAVQTAEDALKHSGYSSIDFTIDEDMKVYDAVQKFAAFNIGCLVTTDKEGELQRNSEETECAPGDLCIHVLTKPSLVDHL